MVEILNFEGRPFENVVKRFCLQKTVVIIKQTRARSLLHTAVISYSRFSKIHMLFLQQGMYYTNLPITTLLSLS